MKTKKTYSPEETKRLGVELARKILAGKLGKKAVVVGLFGDLGSGKTTLVQGFLRAVGWKKRVTSPTFVLMRRYPLRGKKFKNIYHLDAYRLKKSDTRHLKLEEIERDPTNILMVEWPENISKRKSGDLIVRLEHGKKENERIVKF